ncbi:response regulator SirA, partial [bacterium]|nr:response regulator SirA [bacterium]
KMSDKRFKEDVDAVAKKILGRVGEVRIIIIAGPSCSNKTTTTVIIGKALSQAGLKLKQLNVDDYFKNLEDQPKDEFGDYDFEMPEAIDIDLLNENCRDLIGGKSIQKPRYNFKTGHRESYAEFRLEKDEILLIDCLHGLYRRLTASVPAVNKFSIYIESMNILRDTENMYTRWADIRMLKRMIRDVKYRNYSTEQTLAHWPYVRKGELKHILPYILSTDAVINAGLPYELPALKKSLENIMPPSEFIDNLRKEGRLDAYIRGVRVKSLLETVDPIEDLSIIPATSPLREFIGGSAYAIPHNE